MICYHPPAMGSVPITEAVNQRRRVNPHGTVVQAARALGISFGDYSDEASPFLPSENIELPGEILNAEEVAEDAAFSLELAQEATEEAMY